MDVYRPPISEFWVVLVKAIILSCFFTVACTRADPADEDGGSSADGDTDADTDTGSDSDADTDSDTDVDSDTDSETEAPVECWDTLVVNVYSGFGFGTVGDSSQGPFLSFVWGIDHGEDIINFAMISYSDLGGPTAPGEYPVDAEVAAGTGGFVANARQIDGETSATKLLYMPVEGTGSVVFTQIPPVFDSSALDEGFTFSGTFDMRQVDVDTHEPVDGGCYLSGVHIVFDAAIIEP